MPSTTTQSAAALLQCAREGTAHRTHRREVEPDPAPVIAVERLHHDREPDALRGLDGVVGGAHDPALGHRQPGRLEQLPGELLVARDVDGERGRERGHRRPDALLVPPLAELHEALVVQPDERHVAARGLVEDRLRRGPERAPLREQDQPLELVVEVEVLRPAPRDGSRDERRGGRRQGRPVPPSSRRSRCTGRACRCSASSLGRPARPTRAAVRSRCARRRGRPTCPPRAVRGTRRRALASRNARRRRAAARAGPR